MVEPTRRSQGLVLTQVSFSIDKCQLQLLPDPAKKSQVNRGNILDGEVRKLHLELREEAVKNGRFKEPNEQNLLQAGDFGESRDVVMEEGTPSNGKQRFGNVH